jgi:Transposase DDE domain
MTSKVSTPVAAQNLRGFKYFRALRPLLARLHDSGTARDHAGNRSLHFDHYCTLVLLALFNPVVRSLRGMQRASDLSTVRKRLGVPRTSLGSLSESSHVFDPDLLVSVMQELAGRLRPVPHDPRLNELRHLLTAVDGTVLKALPHLAEAMWLKTKDGQPQHAWRLHTHFDILRGVPTRIRCTDARNQGPSNEKTVLRHQLQPDHCYVLDRLYAQFHLFNDIVAAHSSYVCRLRDNSRFDVVEARPLTSAAQAAGVVQDALVHLGMGSKAKQRPTHPVRLVAVAVRPHQKRGGRKGKTAGPASNGLLLVATNLLDVPAELIALIYQYRWTIEIFFRFFKHVLGCQHLFSAFPQGIAIQTYCAIIACMLINLWTGRKPTVATYEMLCWNFLGWATDTELQAHLEKLARPPPK